MDLFKVFINNFILEKDNFRKSQPCYFYNGNILFILILQTHMLIKRWPHTHSI